MRRFVLIFCALLISCTARNAPPRFVSADEHRARIEQHLIAPDYAPRIPKNHDSLADRLAHWHVPGVSIAVINNGKVDWAHGYGVADLQTGAPVDEHTLFHGASLSKPVNAI